MLRYEVVDVFTDQPFTGNPLAVVLDADELSGAQMQAMAREFQLSETAFVVSPTPEDREGGADYRLRVFTPTVELPFAGHPSIGAAWVLASLGRLGTGTVVQACGAGLMPLTVGEGGGRVELTGGTPTLSEELPVEPLLAAVGLSEEDRNGPPPRLAGTGIDFAYLSVLPRALRRASPDLAVLRTLDGAPRGVFVFSWDGRTADARVFAGGIGVTEDAATGSGALGLGVYLVGVGLLEGQGSSRYEVRQGVEMGRPSTLYGEVVARESAAVLARVAGDVVPVARGEVRAP